jgi:hypothetical protein
MQAWCTYRTSHPSGHFYHGKGKTALVSGGKYKGSGVRFNLAIRWNGYEWDTWETVVLEMFDTEDEAYIAEEKLVTHESLANPYCMNMMQGGRRGKYKTPSSLLRRYKSEAKRERAAALRESKRLKAAAAKTAMAAKLKAAKAKARR